MIQPPKVFLDEVKVFCVSIVCRSNVRNLKERYFGQHGAPQGIALGPELFILYNNDTKSYTEQQQDSNKQ